MEEKPISLGQWIDFLIGHPLVGMLTLVVTIVVILLWLYLIKLIWELIKS